jgi:glycerophosphoryl diester phosphodiesterase
MAGGRVDAIGHRGASRDRPENTFAAFDEALRQGCDGIELDLRLSADGVPVVHHDADLGKAGKPGRRVGDLSLVELRRLDLGSWFDARFAGEPLPTLDEVLERYAGRTRLLLEIKNEESAERNHELARATVERIAAAGGAGSVAVLSFEPQILESVAELAPELPRVRNLRPPSRLGPVLRDALEPLAALCVDVRTLTVEFGDQVREAGRPLWVYTCNGERRLARALAAGAAAVISDRPGWLVARLSGTTEA